MDVNDLRMLVTVLGLVLFVGICLWAWSRRRRADFDEAAQLPFAGDGDADAHPGSSMKDRP